MPVRRRLSSNHGLGTVIDHAFLRSQSFCGEKSEIYSRILAFESLSLRLVGIENNTFTAYHRLLSCKKATECLLNGSSYRISVPRLSGNVTKMLERRTAVNIVRIYWFPHLTLVVLCVYSLWVLLLLLFFSFRRITCQKKIENKKVTH